jgi:hypothetical protein
MYIYKSEVKNNQFHYFSTVYLKKTWAAEEKFSCCGVNLGWTVRK